MTLRTFVARFAGLLVFTILCCTAYASATPITINKQFSPNVVGLGQTTTVTVTLQNNSTTSSGTNAQFTDDIGSMSGGGLVDSAIPTTNTCGGAVNIVGNVVTLTGGTIPIAPNVTTPGSCSVTFTIFGDKAGNSVNTILASSVSAVVGGITVNPPGDAQQTLNVQSTNIVVSNGPTQTILVGAVAPSPTAQETFTIGNTTNVDLTNVAFPINVSTANPYTYTVTSATITGPAGCALGTVVLPATGTASAPVSFSGVTIPANTTCTVNVFVATNATTTQAPATVNLTLPSNGITSDQAVTNSNAASDQAKYVVGNPTITKSFTPNAIQPNGTSVLTIRIANALTVQTLDNAALTDNLPAGLTVSNPPAATTTCAGGTVTAANGATSVALSGATITANGNCTITVTVTSATASTYTNTIPATGPGSFTSTEVNGSAGPATAQLLVTGTGGGISIGKAASVASAGPNTPFKITLTFNSVALGAFTGGTFIDMLPTGPTSNMVVYNDGGADAPANNCGGTVTAMNGAASASGNNLAIPAGGTCTVTFYAEFIGNTPGTVVPFTNTLAAGNVSFLNATSNPTAPALNASVTVNELPVFTLSNYNALPAPQSGKSLANQPITVQAALVDNDPTGTLTDSNFNATFNLNAGSVQLAPSPNFTFSAGCPAGLSSANVTPGANGESFTLSIPAPMTLSATCTFTYNVIDEGGALGTFVPGTSSYTSNLTGGAGHPSGSFTGTNAVTFASTNINITKAFTPNQIQAGSTSVAGITLSVAAIAGFAQTQALGVSVPDTLPANVSFASPANVTFSPGCQQVGQPAPSYVISGSTITASGISLDASQPACTIGFTVTSTVLGAPVNIIPAHAVTSTSGITNSQSVNASLTVASGVAVQKTYVSNTLQIGGTDYIRFLLTNSAVTAPGLSGGILTDNMPAQLVLASTTLGPLQPGDGALTLCGGNVTGTVGSSTYTLTNITIPPLVGVTPGQCLLYVAVGASATAAPGPVTNTIGVGGLVIGGYGNQQPSSGTNTLTPAPNVTLAKAFSPIQIQPGGTSTLTITVTNTAAGAAPLSGMTLTDTMPANVSIAATPNASSNCTPGKAVSSAIVATTATSVSLAGGTLAANDSCTITVSVTSSTSGIWTNSIAAGAFGSTQGATNSGPAQAVLNVGNVSGIGISKTFAPAVIAPGATSVLTVTLENIATNAVALTNVAVTDPLPAGVTVAATPNAATTCTGGSAAAAAGGSTLALAGASLAINASCTFSVNVTGTIANTYTNTIPANSITTAQGSSNGAPAVANLTIGQPSLAVVKTSSPSGTTVSPGETVTYTVVVSNGGTQAETNAHITDTLTNATLVPGSVTVNGVAAPDAVVLTGQTFGTLAVGASTTIKYSAVVNAGATTGAQVANTAVAGGDQPCANGTCSGFSPPNTVQPPVLAVNKLIDGLQSEAVVPGQTVTYGITVANSGSSPAINATVTDQVPAGLTVVPNSVMLNGVAYPSATLSGQTLTVPIALIAAGSSPVVSFKATVGANAGNASNTASATALGMTTSTESNAALARTVPATIVVTKAASATTVTTGDRVDYSIVVAPANGIAYGATTVVDTLPDYELYAPGTARVAGKAQEPLVAGHVLTWSLPALTAPVTITYATAIGVGAPPNGTLTNTVNATAIAPGGGGAGHGSASASVLVVGSTLGSCYPITGRVYFDANGTGRFADPDVGLPNVHVFLDDGESVTTDPYGRYDFPCVHPGMHALRLDATTLPPGVVPFDDRNIDSEKSTRRLVHHIYDTTIIEDINFALTGTAPALPARR
jgi:uncharacterized repeat protein (TIGR01451 family)